MERRVFLVLAAGMVVLPKMMSRQSGEAIAEDVDIDAILRDPDAPLTGGPDRDVVLASFSDYNCPFCKAAESDLKRLVREDGKVGIVRKDWPILTDASLYGARLALAARYQDRYDAVHEALMSVPGVRIPQEQMLAAIRAADVDSDRLLDDLHAHAAEIDALLARNDAQARKLELKGTPSYLIGRRLYNTLDFGGFSAAIANARRQSAPEGAS
ncbi:MAG: thioredoxin domain-containing protein [Bradyrhizobium sp.]